MQHHLFRGHQNFQHIQPEEIFEIRISAAIFTSSPFANLHVQPSKSHGFPEFSDLKRDSEAKQKFGFIITSPRLISMIDGHVQSYRTFLHTCSASCTLPKCIIIFEFTNKFLIKNMFFFENCARVN